MTRPARSPWFQVAEMGQSVWLDSLKRGLIRSGELKRLIEEEGLRGMTSNPAIFEKAMSGSEDYDAQFRDLLQEKDRDVKSFYESLAIQDIQDAADLLRPVYDRTQGVDGYVSLEVSPFLARDTAGTIEEARRLWKRVSRRNVMIKVPATEEGIPAIRALVSEGLNINITLLFAQERYEQVADAYISGLEDYLQKEGSEKKELGRIASVASFFLSRIDTLADNLMEERIKSTPEEDRNEKESMEKLKGRVAIANAKLAYRRYQKNFASDRWHKLAAQGAKPQRLLWASTSTKNPRYRDVMYIEELIGPETVTTVPPETFAAFRDHGQVKETLTQDVDKAARELQELETHRISLHEVTEILTTEAIRLFSEPFEKLLGSLEKKRRFFLGSKMNGLSYELPAELNLIVDERLNAWARSGRTRALWAEDSRVWTGDGESEWLGWLHSPSRMRKKTREISSFADEIRKEGFRDFLVLGMGGSSLSVEVFARVFGKDSLKILDSTNPEQIEAVKNSLDLERTLFIVSSKSGGTLEPNLLFEYFWEKLADPERGRRFIAITDPDSPLATLARERGFRKIFYGDPRIGGRYSALSEFGIVPAALAGVELEPLLERSELMMNSCSQWAPARENSGVLLGIVLGALAHHNRNKITFVSSPGIRSLEAWLEQLLAESLGKRGKGLIPITGEDVSSVEAYGPDRIFVFLKLEGSEGDEVTHRLEEKLEKLQDSGQPVIRILIRDRMNLGQEFFRWEIATAVVGAVMGVNPFDQPDVEASKLATRRLMSEYERTKVLPQDTSVEIHSPKLQEELRTALKLLRIGDFFAILAYLPPTSEICTGLENIRMMIRNHMRVATCLEFGPRFLHSTGQVYKGGPNCGVFLQIVAETSKELAIPGRSYDFGTVFQAQAMGDYRVLLERRRKAVNLRLSGNILQGVQQLHSATRHVLHSVPPLNNQVNTEGINRELARRSRTK